LTGAKDFWVYFSKKLISLSTSAKDLLDEVLLSCLVDGTYVVEGRASEDEREPAVLARARAENVAGYFVQRGVKKIKVSETDSVGNQCIDSRKVIVECLPVRREM
jgi:hypothetical protein